MHNPAAQRCYGDESNALVLGENSLCRRFVDSEVVEQAISRLSAGQVFNINTKVKTQNGIRWHEVEIQLTSDPVTGAQLILVNEKDVSHQKQAEDSLRENEERYRLLAEDATKRLLHEAYYDKLTGLPNRALFMRRLESVFECATQRQSNQPNKQPG